jgi:hypothetical protein
VPCFLKYASNVQFCNVWIQVPNEYLIHYYSFHWPKPSQRSNGGNYSSHILLAMVTRKVQVLAGHMFEPCDRV